MILIVYQFIRNQVPDEAECTPEFVDKLHDLTIKDGESLLLKCHVKAVPEAQIEWTKNGEILRSSDIIDLKYKNGVASLAIGEVFPEDEGDYVCKATNSQGTGETRCKLTVIRKFDILPSIMITTYGSLELGIYFPNFRFLLL